MDAHERQLLKTRRQQQLHERRARRRNELQLSRHQANNAPIVGTTVADLEALTGRPGFLREQLKLKGLTPLRRWCLQLKLMTTVDESLQSSKDGGAMDMKTVMQNWETALASEQRCYDVVYREGVRVSDARDSLLDEGAPMDVRRVLSFSTRSNGIVCRVTCLHDGNKTLFSCTKYVDNLQTELEHLLNDEKSADAVITFIHNALKP